MAKLPPYVERSGNSISLKVKTLLASGLGAIILEYVYGFAMLVDTVLGGGADALDSAGAYLSVDLIPMLFGLPSTAIRILWESNAAFVSDTFGPFAQLVVIVEYAIVVGFFVKVLTLAVGRIKRGVG